MGGSISVNECQMTVQSSDGRKWKYSTNQKPARKILEKYGGEWLGWIPAGGSLTPRVIHGFGEPVLVRTRIWIRDTKCSNGTTTWSQRSEFICPTLEGFGYCNHGLQPFRFQGTYKMTIEVYTKEKSIMEQTVTFCICRKMTEKGVKGSSHD